MVFTFLKNPVVRLYSSFAYYQLTLNPFCQHCSNKIMTQAIFVIRCKLFSVFIKIPYVKIQIFRDRSFTWLMNFFCQNISGNSNDWVVRNWQVCAQAISLKFLGNCACAAFNWVLWTVILIGKNLRIPGFFALLSFQT